MTDAAVISAPPPATPVEASARLSEIRSGKDPAWTERYLAGHPETAREFTSLTDLAAKADRVDLAMAGVVSDSSSESQFRVDVVGMLKSANVSEPVVRQFMEGQGVTSEEMRMVEGWKQRHMADRSFVAKYLAGDVEAVRLMTTANLVIANGVREEQK